MTSGPAFIDNSDAGYPKSNDGDESASGQDGSARDRHGARERDIRRHVIDVSGIDQASHGEGLVRHVRHALLGHLDRHIAIAIALGRRGS